MYQLNFKFDIIFLTETRISKKSSSAFNPGKINGYSKYIEQLEQLEIVVVGFMFQTI